MGESSKWYEYVKRLGKVVDRSNLGTDDGRRKNYGEKLFTNMFAGGKDIRFGAWRILFYCSRGTWDLFYHYRSLKS